MTPLKLLRPVPLLGIILLPIFAQRSQAQITPDRTYFGVGRPVPMFVRLPPEGDASARLDIFLAGATEPTATAAVTSGGVDLASLFPMIWTDPAPTVTYVQLVVGGLPLGAPVVLRPMLSPARPMLYSVEAARPYFLDPVTKAESIDPRKGELIYTPDPPAFTGLCAYVDKVVELNTTSGTITLRMRPDEAPNTVWNFLRLVEGGFYTDVVFHRVVPLTPAGHPFVIQVGDPTGTGDGGPGYAIDLEASKLPHDFGVVSMARDSDPNTNGSQIFICLSREGTARLDGKYTSFGEAVAGAEAILAIAATPVKGDRPIDPPVLLSARLVDASPFRQGPSPIARPADKGVEK